MIRLFRRRARCALPWGFLGMAVLVLATELYVGGNGSLFSNPLGLEWRFAAHAARVNAPSCEVLCFGDSLMRYGIVPKVLETILGKPAYNLALSGGTPPASFFQLRRALAAGTRPKAVLVNFVPHLLDWDPRFCAQLLPEVASFRDCVDLGWTTRDANFFATLMLARVFPSVRDRYEIRAKVQNALQEECGLSRETASINPMQLRVDNQVEEKPWFQVKSKLVASMLYPATWRSSPANAAYVRRFLELANALDIPVFWLIPPLSPSVQTLREQRGLEALYTEYTRAVLAQFPKMVVIDGRRAGYDESVHVDHLHLSKQGAIAFSAEVGVIVGRYLSGAPENPRWVELPGYSDRTGESSSLQRIPLNESAAVEGNGHDSDRQRLASLKGSKKEETEAATKR